MSKVVEVKDADVALSILRAQIDDSADSELLGSANLSAALEFLVGAGEAEDLEVIEKAKEWLCLAVEGARCDGPLAESVKALIARFSGLPMDRFLREVIEHDVPREASRPIVKSFKI